VNRLLERLEEKIRCVAATEDGYIYVDRTLLIESLDTIRTLTRAVQRHRAQDLQHSIAKIRTLQSTIYQQNETLLQTLKELET
jgi:hypothetical protein